MLKKIIPFAILILLLSCFYFFYSLNSRALNLTAGHIEGISLIYYTNRGMVQNKPVQSLSLRDEINKADLHFLKNPKMTAVAYESLLKKDPGNNSVQLRLGMIYLKLKQFDAAKEHFYFVYENKDSGLQPDAAWFLGLISIIEDNRADSKNYLEECIAKKCSYKKEAAELLSSL